MALTDSQKIEALIDLLDDALHALEMTQYEIENPEESSKVVTKADQYHEQMIQILHQ